jgi:4-carboxymuconolactone decarboxylase
VEKRSDAFRAGEKVRREVLTDDFVDQKYASANAFDRDLQDYLTEHAWGAVWARPGLDRRTRSLITVSLLAALGLRSEMPRHVAATLRNGGTTDEIKEAFLQTAVYAGAPRAVDAFEIARPVIEAWTTQRGA